MGVIFVVAIVGFRGFGGVWIALVGGAIVDLAWLERHGCGGYRGVSWRDVRCRYRYRRLVWWVVGCCGGYSTV